MITPCHGLAAMSVLAERTPGTGGEFVDLASQSRDALWASVCTGKRRVEPHEPLLVHGSILYPLAPGRPCSFLKRVLRKTPDGDGCGGRRFLVEKRQPDRRDVI
jgi:hypothetical protein